MDWVVQYKVVEWIWKWIKLLGSVGNTAPRSCRNSAGSYDEKTVCLEKYTYMYGYMLLTVCTNLCLDIVSPS